LKNKRRGNLAFGTQIPEHEQKGKYQYGNNNSRGRPDHVIIITEYEEPS